MGEIGKFIILTGFLLVLIGVMVVFMGKIPGVGRLPGDILIKKENVTFYFPLATCLIISALLSLIIFLWQRR